MVKVLTRTGTMRNGPQTNSTVGITSWGTFVFFFEAPPRRLLATAAEAVPSKLEALKDPLGYSIISNAERRECNPVPSASPAAARATGFRFASAIVSEASMARLNEKLSLGSACTASGLGFWPVPVALGAAGSQL